MIFPQQEPKARTWTRTVRIWQMTDVRSAYLSSIHIWNVSNSIFKSLFPRALILRGCVQEKQGWNRFRLSGTTTRKPKLLILVANALDSAETAGKVKLRKPVSKAGGVVQCSGWWAAHRVTASLSCATNWRPAASTFRVTMAQWDFWRPECCSTVYSKKVQMKEDKYSVSILTTQWRELYLDIIWKQKECWIVNSAHCQWIQYSVY